MPEFANSLTADVQTCVRIMSELLREHKAEYDTGVRVPSMADALLEAADETGEYEEEDVAWALFGMCAAGQDTSATTMEWMLLVRSAPPTSRCMPACLAVHCAHSGCHV